MKETIDYDTMFHPFIGDDPGTHRLKIPTVGDQRIDFKLGSPPRTLPTDDSYVEYSISQVMTDTFSVSRHRPHEAAVRIMYVGRIPDRKFFVSLMNNMRHPLPEGWDAGSPKPEVLPCDATCAKCGGSDIHLVSYSAGQDTNGLGPNRLTPSTKWVKRSDAYFQPAKKDCIVFCCRTCQHKWDGDPLHPEEKKNE